MRIVVNDIAASSGGAMTILKDFYQYVKDHDTENEWIFLLCGPHLEETERIQVKLLPQVKKSHWKKLWFDLFAGKKYLSALQPDVVFSLQNIISFGLKVRQVVYIHQPIPFQKVKRFSFLRHEERILALYQYIIGFIIKASARQANQVIVQTEWMKEAVCRQAKVSDVKVAKIQPNVENIRVYQKKYVFSNQTFFYPTSPTIYKNNACIEKACELLWQKGIRNFTVKLTLPIADGHNGICYTGVIPREQVLQEYSRATLIFPSYIESFGLPLAEARQIGTLILASDCPFSREVLSGYVNAYFIDPFQPESLAALMEQVITGQIQKMPEIHSVQSQANSWSEIISVIQGVS